jgi:hypothetical protein
MVKGTRNAVLASLMGAALVFGTPLVASAEKADVTRQSVQKSKDKDDGREDKKDTDKKDRKTDKEAADKKDRVDGNDNRKGDNRKGHDRDQSDRQKGNDKDGDRRDRDSKAGGHGDDRNRNWDHDRDRDHRRHDWDTNRRYYRYGYYGPGYYDDCGYYGSGYRGDGGNWSYYGPDACSYEYGGYGSSYLVRMSGDQVVPDRGPGDAVGTANVEIDPAAARVCYRLAYDGVPQATGAQIRMGRPGENGPAVVAFSAGENGDDGCVPADPRLLSEIQNDPRGYYVSVDADGFPNGAMRGQLDAPDYRSGARA